MLRRVRARGTGLFIAPHHARNFPHLLSKERIKTIVHCVDKAVLLWAVVPACALGVPWVVPGELSCGFDGAVFPPQSPAAAAAAAVRSDPDNLGGPPVSGRPSPAAVSFVPGFARAPPPAPGRELPTVGGDVGERQLPPAGRLLYVLVTTVVSPSLFYVVLPFGDEPAADINANCEPRTTGSWWGPGLRTAVNSISLVLCSP